MKNTIYALAISLLCTLATCSCMRDPIVYPTSNYYLSIEDQVAEGDPRPEIYSVHFYNPENGTTVLKTFVNASHHPEGKPRGGYIQGLTAGSYIMLVYNYDTKTVRVNNDQNDNKVFADTETYSYNSGSPIIKMPDHLYVDRQEVYIPYVTGESTYIIPSSPKTVIEKHPITIHGIKNLGKAVKASVYISGQAPGRWLGTNNTTTEGNAIIAWYADLTPAGTKAIDGETISTEYLTFGRSRGGERALLTLYITGPGGTTTWGQEDVSDQISDGGSGIEVTFDMEVTEHEQSGFEPVADEWVPEKTEIDLF